MYQLGHLQIYQAIYFAKQISSYNYNKGLNNVIIKLVSVQRNLN